METKRTFLRHLHLPVLVFVGVGAAVLGLIYGFPVGLLVLGYYYIGLHVSQLADRRSSDQAEARSETAVSICDPASLQPQKQRKGQAKVHLNA
jgi:hypothetical protein